MLCIEETNRSKLFHVCTYGKDREVFAELQRMLRLFLERVALIHSMQQILTIIYQSIQLCMNFHRKALPQEQEQMNLFSLPT